MYPARMAKMSTNVSKLSPKQEQAILALVTNQGVDNAARAVGGLPRTLYRWMSEPLFDKAYRKARRDAFGQGKARLQQASGAAVSSILKIMVDRTRRLPRNSGPPIWCCRMERGPSRSRTSRRAWRRWSRPRRYRS